MGFPLALYDILRTEPSDAPRAAEVKDAVGRDGGSAVAELIALQTVVGKVVLEEACLGVEACQTVVGAQPQTSVGMALDGTHAIVGEAVLSVEVLQYLSV